LGITGNCRRKIDVIIDSISDNGYIGRTYGDAPEVDGTFSSGAQMLKAGSIIRAEVTGSKDYDLTGIA